LWLPHGVEVDISNNLVWGATSAYDVLGAFFCWKALFELDNEERDNANFVKVLPKNTLFKAHNFHF